MILARIFGIPISAASNHLKQLSSSECTTLEQMANNQQ